jgi:hypothetical protein
VIFDPFAVRTLESEKAPILAAPHTAARFRRQRQQEQDEGQLKRYEE